MAEIRLLLDGESSLRNDGRVIAYTNKPIDTYDILVIDGKTYSVCMVNLKTGNCGVREINLRDEKDTGFEDELTCPYCGYRDSNSWELSDDDGETDCDRCGAGLEYKRFVDVTYSAEVKSRPNMVIIEDDSNV